jgi:hypothetical protein
MLAVIALAGLVLGLVAWFIGWRDWASWCWAGGTIPVVVGLLASMIRDFLAGRVGVDAVAFVSMSGALVLGQNLAGIVIAVMYAGGNILEDFAVARAEHDLRSLIDRAPKVAHRRVASTIEDVPIEQVAVGDDILVRAGEVIPVDGIIASPAAMLEPRSAGSQLQFPVRRGSWPGAVPSMPEMHSKSALLQRRMKVHTRGSLEWLVRHRQRRPPLSDWQTDTRCCSCRSPSSLREERGCFPVTLSGRWPC